MDCNDILIEIFRFTILDDKTTLNLSLVQKRFNECIKHSLFVESRNTKITEISILDTYSMVFPDDEIRTKPFIIRILGEHSDSSIKDILMKSSFYNWSMSSDIIAINTMIGNLLFSTVFSKKEDRFLRSSELKDISYNLSFILLSGNMTLFEEKFRDLMVINTDCVVRKRIIEDPNLVRNMLDPRRSNRIMVKLGGSNSWIDVHYCRSINSLPEMMNKIYA